MHMHMSHVDAGRLHQVWGGLNRATGTVAVELGDEVDEHPQPKLVAVPDSTSSPSELTSRTVRSSSPGPSRSP